MLFPGNSLCDVCVRACVRACMRLRVFFWWWVGGGWGVGGGAEQALVKALQPQAIAITATMLGWQAPRVCPVPRSINCWCPMPWLTHQPQGR